MLTRFPSSDYTQYQSLYIRYTKYKILFYLRGYYTCFNNKIYIFFMPWTHLSCWFPSDYGPTKRDQWWHKPILCREHRQKVSPPLISRNIMPTVIVLYYTQYITTIYTQKNAVTRTAGIRMTKCIQIPPYKWAMVNSHIYRLQTPYGGKAVLHNGFTSSNINIIIIIIIIFSHRIIAVIF